MKNRIHQHAFDCTQDRIFFRDELRAIYQANGIDWVFDSGERISSYGIDFVGVKQAGERMKDER